MSHPGTLGGWVGGWVGEWVGGWVGERVGGLVLSTSLGGIGSERPKPKTPRQVN
jgi:hypothetical protein